MDIQAVLEEIQKEVAPYIGRGRVADYIPALARVPGDRFAMVVRRTDGAEYAVGDADTPFSIQSISKLFTLMQLLGFGGPDIWHRVGREPSGSAFNSLVQLEHESGIPRNPFINAGALVITDMIASCSADASRRIGDFYRMLSGNPANRVDEAVARSEAEHGFRNAALANFMASFGNIESPVPELLNSYFRQCALTTSCRDLARAADTIGYEILTGLGRDGAVGLAELRDRGASTLGQDRDSCVVYGMPRAANDLGALDKQLPLEAIAREICLLADAAGGRG